MEHCYSRKEIRLSSADVQDIVTSLGIGNTTPASIPMTFSVEIPSVIMHCHLDIHIKKENGSKVFFQHDEHHGYHSITFTPDEPGYYKIKIMCGSQKAPGSPFYVQAIPTGDPIQCKITFDNSTVGIGQETVSTVCIARAGLGKVTACIIDPLGHPVKPDIVEQDPETTLVKYTPRNIGIYRISILFGGIVVPGGSFVQEVVPNLKKLAIDLGLDDTDPKFVVETYTTLVKDLKQKIELLQLENKSLRQENAQTSTANPFGATGSSGMNTFVSGAPVSTVNPFGISATSSTLPMTNFSQAGGMPVSTSAGDAFVSGAPVSTTPTHSGAFSCVANFEGTATSISDTEDTDVDILCSSDD